MTCLITVHCPSFTTLAFLVVKMSLSEVDVVWYRKQIHSRTLMEMAGDMTKSPHGYWELQIVPDSTYALFLPIVYL